jgi:hypothetical protein
VLVGLCGFPFSPDSRMNGVVHSSTHYERS